MKSEFNITEPRTLKLTYTVQREFVVIIHPGGGSVARAMEDAIRHMHGEANVDASSVKFEVIDNG